MQQVIVITGASRGIGAATALTVAAPKTHLVLAARNSADLESVAEAARSQGAHTTVVPCDVSAEPHVRRLIEQAAGITGQIDVLINAAGGALIGPFDQLSLADWEGMLRVNLTGTFLVCKHASPYLQAGSSVINVASVAARQAFPGWAAYSASKAGLLAFTNTIREELRTRQIRVVALLPAATDTALWDSLPGAWNRGNMIQSADVANTIAWVISQPASVTIEELMVGHVAGRL
jgi:3-oxoacyl-[acyl-carrier protein] reductase